MSALQYAFSRLQWDSVLIIQIGPISMCHLITSYAQNDGTFSVSSPAFTNNTFCFTLGGSSPPRCALKLFDGHLQVYYPAYSMLDYQQFKIKAFANFWHSNLKAYEARTVVMAMKSSIPFYNQVGLVTVDTTRVR